MGTLHHILPPELRPALASARVLSGRELAEERRRRPREAYLPTASAAFDRLLAGGLERGTTVEIVGSRSSGRFAFVVGALAAVTGSGEAAALIDLGDGFDPQVAAAAGVELERLLWVRPRRMKDVLASAEVVLTTGMPLVVLDLGMPPLAGGRGAEAAWLRLARSARTQRTALVVSSPYRVSGTAAQVVLELRQTRARWHGGREGPRLLAGCESALGLRKCRPSTPAQHVPRSGREAVAWWTGELVERPLEGDLAAAPAARLPVVPALAERAIA